MAEGDILTLCIRLFSELLLNRYQLPLPDPDESLLSRHAHSILTQNRSLLKQFKSGHRSVEFNNLVLPQSGPAVEAIGHAMAYSAGLRAGVPQCVLDVYEADIIRRDPAWYSENAGLSQMDQRRREDAAVTKMMEGLPGYLDGLGIERYVQAPIVSDRAWKAYLEELTAYEGNAVGPLVDLRPDHQRLDGAALAKL